MKPSEQDVFNLMAQASAMIRLGEPNMLNLYAVVAVCREYLKVAYPRESAQQVDK